MDANKLAQNEMNRLAVKADEMIADALLNCTPHRCEVAMRHAEELFNTAPHLAASESEIGGCLHMQYRDLFALYAIAAKK